MNKCVIKYEFTPYYWVMMREVLRAEINFAVVSIYITRHRGCHLGDVLLLVLQAFRQCSCTVDQTQQAEQRSQYVGRSRPTVAPAAHEEGC